MTAATTVLITWWMSIATNAVHMLFTIHCFSFHSIILYKRLKLFRKCLIIKCDLGRLTYHCKKAVLDDASTMSYFHSSDAFRPPTVKWMCRSQLKHNFFQKNVRKRLYMYDVLSVNNNCFDCVFESQNIDFDSIRVLPFLE